MKILIIRLWKLDVKIGCCCIYENQLIWEPGELEKKKINNLIDYHQPKKVCILENGSDSHNIMSEPELVGSHKKVRTAQHWSNCPKTCNFENCPKL